MAGTALQLTLRQLRERFSDPRALGVMVIVGVLIGFAGPFGTFELLPTAGRIAYWVALVFLTYATGFGLALLADRLWGQGRPLWLRLLVQIVPAALGTSLVVGLVNLVAFGATDFSFGALGVLVAQSFAVSAAVVAVSFLTDRPASVAQDSGEPPAPAILDRVPPHQRGGLIALIVEDHYVDIVTERGKTLVLMRLADAIKETWPVPGLQVHRSHWVARAAVVRAHKSDGKVLLQLTNGMWLPVSRSYLPAVKRAELI